MAGAQVDCKWNHWDCRSSNPINHKCGALNNSDFEREDCPFYNPKARRHNQDHAMSKKSAINVLQRQSPCELCDVCDRRESHACGGAGCLSFRTWVGESLRALRVVMGVVNEK